MLVKRSHIAGRALYSMYRGVTVYKSRYIRAQITIGDITKHLGTFSTEVEAALAYNRAALEAYGELAKLNKL